MSGCKNFAPWVIDRLLISPVFALALMFAWIGTIDIANPIGGALFVLGVAMLFAAIRVAVAIMRSQFQLRVRARFLFVDAIWVTMGVVAVLRDGEASMDNIPVLFLLIVSVVVIFGDATSLVIRTGRR